MADNNDYGELNITTPVDSSPPPRSDTDVFAPDPWNVELQGAPAGGMSHNSADVHLVGGQAGEDHNSQQINGDLAS